MNVSKTGYWVSQSGAKERTTNEPNIIVAYAYKNV